MAKTDYSGRERSGEVLAVVRTHFGEYFPEVFRTAYMQNPVRYVDMEDGFPEAIANGQRNLGNKFPEGNLNVNFARAPFLVANIASGVVDKEILRRTRNRADEIKTMARRYRAVADLHGAFGVPEPFGAINRKPTAEVLDLMVGLRYQTILVANENMSAGAMNHAAMIEVPDARVNDELENVRYCLGALAAGRLRSASETDMRKWRMYDYGGRVPADVPLTIAKELGLRTDYAYLEPMPEKLSERLGCAGLRLYALGGWDRPGEETAGEIVSDFSYGQLDFSQLPQENLMAYA